MLKERRWEIMEVGERFGPSLVTVTEQLVKNFAFAADDFNPRYLYGEAGRPRVGQPTLLCREARDVIGTVYDIASGGAGMHTKHECSFFGLPEVGRSYRITGEHTEKYLKREKQYIVLQSEVRDEAGTLVLRQRSTHIRALKPGVAKDPAAAPKREEPAAADDAPVAADRTGIAPGVRLRTLRKTFTQEQLTVFAGTDWKNIHNEPEIARAAGLRGTVASGLQTMAAVSELMEAYFGDGWSDGGGLAVAFTAPVFVDDAITASARITGISEEGGRSFAEAEVWCDGPTGARVLAGTARARL